MQAHGLTISPSLLKHLFPRPIMKLIELGMRLAPLIICVLPTNALMLAHSNVQEIFNRAPKMHRCVKDSLAIQHDCAFPPNHSPAPTKKNTHTHIQHPKNREERGREQSFYSFYSFFIFLWGNKEDKEKEKTFRCTQIYTSIAILYICYRYQLTVHNFIATLQVINEQISCSGH